MSTKGLLLTYDTVSALTGLYLSLFESSVPLSFVLRKKLSPALRNLCARNNRSLPISHAPNQSEAHFSLQSPFLTSAITFGLFHSTLVFPFGLDFGLQFMIFSLLYFCIINTYFSVRSPISYAKKFSMCAWRPDGRTNVVAYAAQFCRVSAFK